MAKKISRNTAAANPFGTDEDLSTDFLGDFDLSDGFSPEKIMSQLVKRFGGEFGTVTKEIALREGGFLIAEKALTPAANQVLSFIFAQVGEEGLKKIGITLSPEKAKEYAKYGVDGLAVSAESIVRMVNANGRDQRLRRELHEELSEYLQAGEKGIGRSSALQVVEHPNKILATAEHRLQEQFNHSAAQAGLAFIGSAGQYAARGLDQKTLELEYNDLNALADPASDQKKRMGELAKTLENYAKGNPRNVGSIIADDHGKGMIGRVDQATVAAVGTGFVGHRFMQGQVEARKNAASKVIAYDLIQFADEYLKNEKLENGKINLAAFKKDFPHHKFQKLDYEKTLVPLEEFIAEIFSQHVHDLNPRNNIGSLHQEQLQAVAKQLSNAMTGKDLSTTLLNPIALIKIVGEGTVLSHTGDNVASTDKVRDVINDARAVFSPDHKIDTAAYTSKLMRHMDEITDNFSKLPEKYQDFTLFLIPSAVIREQFGSFKMNDTELKSAKLRAKEDALLITKEVVSELSAMSDRDLEEHQMLSKVQRNVIRKAATLIEKGDEEALVTMVRDATPEGLRYAILNAGEYWQNKVQEKGTHEADTVSKQEKSSTKEPSFIDKIHDDFTAHVKKGHVPELPANDDHMHADVTPHAHIKSEHAQLHGKVEEKEPAMAIK